jgi:hypothetical protein
VRHRQYKQRHYKKKQKHSPRNDCGYRRPRFCRHEFLRESTAEAFALVRPIKFDRRTKGRVTLIGTDSAEMHVLRQLEKNHLSPGNSLPPQENANRFARGECLRCANADLHVPQIGQAAETLGASHLADHTETVENRHLQIQEHSIGRISMDEVKGFTSVCRFDHAVPHGLQEFCNRPPSTGWRNPCKLLRCRSPLHGSFSVHPIFC